MHSSPENPLVGVLTLVASASPGSWHYQARAREYGIDPQVLGEVLELLYLEGLVTKGQSCPQQGPGIVLTDLGRTVVTNPELLERLRQGKPIDPANPGAIIRSSLLAPPRIWLTPLLLIANLLVFALTAWVANNAGRLNPFLMMRDGDVIHWMGGIKPSDLLQGQWWRLLTACFVHAGFLHIAMNMYALYGAGRFVEQTWGWWRYLLIYLVAGWGGSCLAMAWRPVDVLLCGASGALCGVLATEAVWVFLYGRYLPQQMARRGRQQILTTVVLLVVISLVPRVSWEAHLGGAVAGGVMALLLHWQRFGPVSAASWLLMALVPLASWAHLQYARQTSPAWLQLEGIHAREVGVPAVSTVLEETLQLCENDLQELMDRHPTRREEAQIQAVVARLQQQRQRLAQVADQVKALRSPVFRELRQTGLQGLDAADRLCQKAIDYLQAGAKVGKAEERAIRELFGQVDDLETQWREQVRQLPAAQK